MESGTCGERGVASCRSAAEALQQLVGALLGLDRAARMSFAAGVVWRYARGVEHASRYREAVEEALEAARLDGPTAIGLLVAR